MLHCAQKLNADDIETIYEGRLEGFIMGLIEYLEENTNLKKLNHQHAREHDITISEWKKCKEILEDENMEL